MPNLFAYICLYIICVLNFQLHTNEIELSIENFLKNKVVFFTGYPGSGKGTQAKILSEKYNIQHLSTGELFREEVKKGSDIGNKMAFYMDQGLIIPKEIVFEYMEKELSKAKYKDGFILDGYPKNLEFYDHLMPLLKKLQITPVAAIHFDISREDVILRLTGRLHCSECNRDFHAIFLPPKIEKTCDHCGHSLVSRSDDKISTINNRLDNFQINTGAVIEKFNEIGILHSIDASLDKFTVQSDLVNLLKSFAQYEIEKSGSYYLRNVLNEEKTSRFHNHIDAETHVDLRSIIFEIEKDHPDFQDKIYPVEYLQLGKQTKNPEFSSVYSHLPNFHKISQAKNEAFSTGKMGEDGFNYEQVRETLNVVLKNANPHIMTELEEDIFEKSIDKDGIETITLDVGNTPYSIDWNELNEFRDLALKDMPKFELHHAFNIKKKIDDETPPIDLQALHEITEKLGFEVGGWFIFRKKNEWAYRSNEFSNANYEICLEKLNQQARFLRKALKEYFSNEEITSSCSLEKVHAIWSLKNLTNTYIRVNTSNSGKLAEFEEYFKPLKVVSEAQDLLEPLADPLTVICYKASQFNNVIVDDVSLDVEGEDIGINIRWFIKDISKYIGKKCTFVCRLGYRTDDIVKIFTASVDGTIVAPRGNTFGFGNYFLPNGSLKTLGECREPQYNPRYLAIQLFKEDQNYVITPPLLTWNGEFQN